MKSDRPLQADELAELKWDPDEMRRSDEGIAERFARLVAGTEHELVTQAVWDTDGAKEIEDQLRVG